ncbi:MAG: hypothetical protein LH477_08540 [Nocardioides sp.]|nr:hypothetical protein [Nocardioides sp.]
MFITPEPLRHGPFARAEGLAAGVPARVLEGTQFVRIHLGVYCHRDHVMTWSDRVEAARIALPASARTTGITRLQQLGLDHGPRDVLDFVVQGDLHLDLDGVFLHRTVAMPSHDDVGVTPEAAFVAYCAETRVLDAIKVGCVLLHQGRLDAALLEQLLVEQPWRRGCAEARWVLSHLDDRCRSFPEAELLALVLFAGLPEPEVNKTIELGVGDILTPDLWFEDYGLAVEYEGSQHQEDRGQYNADIDRYKLYRRTGTAYEQVTKERMRSPKATVRQIHLALVARGYEGPPPEFGELWASLFAPVAAVVRPGRAA